MFTYTYISVLGNFLFACKSLHRISESSGVKIINMYLTLSQKIHLRIRSWIGGDFQTVNWSVNIQIIFINYSVLLGFLCYHTVNFLYLSFLAVLFFKSLKCPIKSKYLNFQFLGTAYFSFCLPYFYNGDL